MKKGFTLIELISVIIILSLLFGISIRFNLFNIKEINDFSKVNELFFNKYYEDNIKLLCEENCNKCNLIIDGEVKEEFSNLINEDIQSYTYNPQYGYIKDNKKIYFDDRNIAQEECFSYSFNKNKVFDKELIRNKGKYYYNSYVNGVLEFSSLEEVSEYKDKTISEIRYDF